MRNNRKGNTVALKKEKDTEDKGRIATHKRARFEFYINERFEAGIALQGWEVKSLRQGRVSFGESYVLLKGNEAFLFGCQITPLISANTHVVADKLRTRKLLLHRAQIDEINVAVDRKGATAIPLAMFWKKNKVKVEIALARGKQLHDKRATEKDRDWERDKGRVMRERNR
jgi:SsrA-binding protein